MAKTPAQGTVVNVEIATVMTPFTQLRAFTPPSKKSLSFDATTLDSLWEESEMAGIGTVGNFDLEAFWDPELAVQDAVSDALDANQKTTWEIVYVNAGASEMDFVCSELEHKVTGQMKDGLIVSITGKVDGACVLTV